jgi:hypothetical protein
MILAILAWESAMPFQFNPEMVEKCPNCPPAAAIAINQELYRGIKRPPIDDVDFMSWVENPDIAGDPQNCQHWGLSVWKARIDAEHARRVHNYMRKWHIASGFVDERDGVFMETPRDECPEHCTFWVKHNMNIKSKFKIAMYPLNGRQK